MIRLSPDFTLNFRALNSPDFQPVFPTDFHAFFDVFFQCFFDAFFQCFFDAFSMHFFNALLILFQEIFKGSQRSIFLIVFYWEAYCLYWIFYWSEIAFVWCSEDPSLGILYTPSSDFIPCQKTLICFPLHYVCRIFIWYTLNFLKIVITFYLYEIF